jgi:hypothetical protein
LLGNNGVAVGEQEQGSQHVYVYGGSLDLYVVREVFVAEMIGLGID